MNLFTARLTRKMFSTEQFEKNIKELQERVARYRKVEKSPEMAEYLSLKEVVETTEFQSKMQDLKTRKYSDTEEGKKTALYEKLSSSMRMRGYKRALEMPTFQSFLQFRNSEDFSKMKDPKERRKSPELRMYNMINRSAFYQNYLKVLNSDELRQLTALEEEIQTEQFKAQDAFWKNPHRWETTEEYKQFNRYEQLRNSDDIRFYFAQRAEEIDWAEMFRLSFEDDMSSPKNWKAGYGLTPDTLKDGYSQANEHQAYNSGKNTIFAEGRMDIETRHETVTALAWDGKKGFAEQVFSYTSDVMNTKASFSQQEGMFMAKVRSQGSGHHFFGLSTGKPGSPLIALYHYNGSKHQLGVINGKQSKQVDLTGVLRSMYYVYTLRWTKKELIWYVNNLEVLRMDNTLPKEQMFLLAQSFLPKTESAGEGKLKVQWVRCYKSVE